MIQAYLNDEEIRLFPDIAIGMTIENFNISDIPNRKIDRTNVIRVPKAGNEDIFEFSSIPNAPTDYAYQDYDFDLIADGVKIYENGRAFIIGEDETGYTLNITNAKNIVDLLKSISLATLYEGDTVTIVTVATFLDMFATKTNGFKIDFLFDEGSPAVDEYGFASGIDYPSIYLDTILTKIAADYDVLFSGDLITDADFAKLRIPCVASNFKRDNGSNDIYIDDLVIHDSLSAWDLIKNILQLFCGVFKINGTDMELQKFNDLDVTTPTDWSGKLVSKSKKFSIPDTAQKNYIRYGVTKDVDKDDNSVLISCNNLNLPYVKDLTTMQAKLYPFRDINALYTNASTDPLLALFMPETDSVFPGLVGDPTPSRVKGLKDLVIYTDSAAFLGQPITINFQYYFENVPGAWTNPILSDDLVADANTTIVEYYDLTTNYSLIETMLTDPVFYETELLLNIIDIYGFDHFKAIQIDELEGIFYVNRISNFLITSPGVSTRVELIKIS